MKYDFLNIISSSLAKTEIQEIRKDFSSMRSYVQNTKSKNILLQNGFSEVAKEYLIGEINQILETQTIERTKYYVKRLQKSLNTNKAK